MDNDSSVTDEEGEEEVLTQEPSQQQDSIAVRRPRREIRKPARFVDMVAYALPIVNDDVPSSYKEAIRSSECTSNRVADALSRRSNLLATMTLSVPGFESFKELLETDPFFTKIMAGLGSQNFSEFFLVDGFLFHGNHYVFLSVVCGCKLSKNYTEGHLGRDRTLQLVRIIILADDSAGGGTICGTLSCMSSIKREGDECGSLFASTNSDTAMDGT
ncbi:hypothetical protein LWI29_025983 [Acer saccharum]|uniref:Uncharacterized protein n=1 Tax=Acer saccharum TaxID=4024 RepID=A0AA39SR47_ACESA|nr:hypothetical protein LWI29_025983 [Acer saccharum]